MIDKPGRTLTSEWLKRVIDEIPNMPETGSVYFCRLCRPSGMRTEDEMDEHMSNAHGIGPEWRERCAKAETD